MTARSLVGSASMLALVSACSTPAQPHHVQAPPASVREPESPSRFFVSGKVTRPDGRPISGVRVYTIFPGDASWVGDTYDTQACQTHSLADGSFSLGPFDRAYLTKAREQMEVRSLAENNMPLPRLPAELFEVHASEPGFRFASPVAIGGARDDVVLRLRALTGIRGDARLAGTDTVVAASLGLARNLWGWDLRDAACGFEFPDLEPGRYRLFAWTDERMLGSTPWLELVEGRPIEDLHIELQPACTVRVEPWPGDDAAFAWIRVDGHGLPAWITDDPTPGTFHTFAGHVEIELSGRDAARPTQTVGFDLAPGETRVVEFAH